MRIAILFFLAFILLALPGQGQRRLRLADQKFEQKHYADAAKRYGKLLEKDPMDVHLVSRMAHSLRLLNDYEAAEPWYERAVNLDNVQPDVLFFYAHTLLYNQKFDEAIQWMNLYLRLRPNDQRARNMLENESFLRKLINNPADVSIQYLDINSAQFDFAPAFRGDAHIVFSSARQDLRLLRERNSRDNTPVLKLYEAQLKQGELVNLTLFAPELDKGVHMGPVSFSSNGNEMFFTRNIYQRISRREARVNRLSIYRAVWKGGQWEEVEEMPFNSTAWSVGHPALSADGKTLFFISDMPGGYGETDIYKVERTPSGWGQPENLGPDINTAGRELFPFVHTDGTLYFSSDGHPTLGGLDIFLAIPTADGFETPINMGMPVNSHNDDISFILHKSGQYGLMASNRKERRYDDIYFFANLGPLPGKDSPDPDEDLIADQSDPIPDEKPDSVMPVETDTPSVNQITDAGPRPRTNGAGYSPTPTESPDDEPAPLTHTPGTQTTPITSGWENIYFDFSRSFLRDLSMQHLDQVVHYLSSNPDKGLVINGHTDLRGESLYNVYLAQARAHSVTRYLLDRGVDAAKLYPKGYGETRPAVAAATSEEEHQLNRRVVIEVLPMTQVQGMIQNAVNLSHLNLITEQKAEFLPGVEYRIQILASAMPVPPQRYQLIRESFPAMTLFYYYSPDRLHRYMVGSFADYDEVITAERQLRRMGFETYIVAYKDGQRVSVREARRG
jgi:outer membrane protein OmpA-like peptidoglycan-associated protein